MLRVMSSLVQMGSGVLCGLRCMTNKILEDLRVLLRTLVTNFLVAYRFTKQMISLTLDTVRTLAQITIL